MHLLIIAPEQIPVPPGKGGSVEICILAIARQLARQHQVTVISRSHPGYSAVDHSGGLTIVRVPTGSPTAYISAVMRHVRGHRFDLIQIDNRPRFVPRIKSLFPDTPVSLFLHSLTFVSRPMISSREAARCLKRADVIIANSNSLKSALAERFPQVRGKIREVHLGVDLQRFRLPSAAERSGARARSGLGASFAVAFAGRLIPRKGADVLLRAVHRLRREVPSAKVILAGGGKAGYKAKLSRLARDLQVPAIFLGRVAHRRMREVYWAADCFVCPSQKHEAFGLVNVEAMASGVPCVASRNGGIKEIVRHGENGLLVDRYHSPQAFAQALLRIEKHSDLARQLAAQARRDTVRRFSWADTAGRLIKVYRNMKGE